MRNGTLVGWVLAAVVMLVGMALGGCAGWEVGRLPTVESVEHEKARAEELLVRVREARAGSEVAAADDGLTESERGRLLGEAERARSAEKVIEAGIAEMEAVIREVRRPTDEITVGLGALGHMLPSGVGGPLVLGGALLVSVLRLVQMRRALESVARSIDVAAREDVDLKERLRESAPTLRSIQTPTAQRVIDATQGKALRIPV